MPWAPLGLATRKVEHEVERDLLVDDKQREAWRERAAYPPHRIHFIGVHLKVFLGNLQGRSTAQSQVGPALEELDDGLERI